LTDKRRLMLISAKGKIMAPRVMTNEREGIVSRPLGPLGTDTMAMGTMSNHGWYSQGALTV